MTALIAAFLSFYLLTYRRRRAKREMRKRIGINRVPYVIYGLLIACIASFVLPLTLAIAIALLTVFISWAYNWWSQLRLQQKHEADIAVCLRVIARSLSSGSGLHNALEDAACEKNLASPVFNQLSAHSRNSGLNEALLLMKSKNNSYLIRLLSDALTMSTKSGGSHLAAIECVLRAHSDSHHATQVARTSAMQSLASALVLTVLPLVVIAVQLLFSQSARLFFMSSPLGGWVFLVGILLDCAGGWLMLKLLQRNL